MSLRIARIASAILLVLVLIGAFLPGHEKHLLLDPFPTRWHVDKIGHAVGFMMAIFSIDRARLKGVRGWHVIAFAVLLAAFTETGQIFIAGRTPAVTDALIDTMGALAGFFVSVLLAD